MLIVCIERTGRMSRVTALHVAAAITVCASSTTATAAAAAAAAAIASAAIRVYLQLVGRRFHSRR